MKDKLYAEWNELQKRPIAEGNTSQFTKKMQDEIRIMRGLLECGEKTTPDGYDISKQVWERLRIAREIVKSWTDEISPQK